jgi:hypothetical protein
MRVPRERWSGGDAYEAYIGRWSRKVAPHFVDWLAIPPGASWLDLGCGTGALTGAVLVNRLQKALGEAVPVALVFDAPTPAALAALMARVISRCRKVQARTVMGRHSSQSPRALNLKT